MTVLNIRTMKRKITALVTIILILLAHSASLLANDHADCKMTKQKSAENNCAMMEMKMDCCPSEQPASQGCECPEMNNASQGDSELPQFIIIKSFENPGKIVLQFKTLHHFEHKISTRLHVYSFDSLKPANKIYKTIQSFLI